MTKHEALSHEKKMIMLSYHTHQTTSTRTHLRKGDFPGAPGGQRCLLECNVWLSTCLTLQLLVFEQGTGLKGSTISLPVSQMPKNQCKVPLHTHSNHTRQLPHSITV